MGAYITGQVYKMHGNCLALSEPPGYICCCTGAVQSLPVLLDRALLVQAMNFDKFVLQICLGFFSVASPGLGPLSFLTPLLCNSLTKLTSYFLSAPGTLQSHQTLRSTSSAHGSSCRWIDFERTPHGLRPAQGSTQKDPVIAWLSK